MTKARCVKESSSESRERDGQSPGIEDFLGHGTDLALSPENSEKAIKNVKEGSLLLSG